MQVDSKRDFMTEVRRQKLKYFGHTVRAMVGTDVVVIIHGL